MCLGLSSTDPNEAVSQRIGTQNNSCQSTGGTAFARVRTFQWQQQSGSTRFYAFAGRMCYRRWLAWVLTGNVIELRKELGGYWTLVMDLAVIAPVPYL